MKKHLDTLTWNGTTWEDVDIDATRHYAADGAPVIELTTAGEPLATATVCLTGYAFPPPYSGHVYLKDYAENDGLARALEEAGLVKLESETGIGRFESRVWLARLLPEAWS